MSHKGTHIQINLPQFRMQKDRQTYRHTGRYTDIHADKIKPMAAIRYTSVPGSPPLLPRRSAAAPAPVHSEAALRPADT